MLQKCQLGVKETRPQCSQRKCGVTVKMGVYGIRMSWLQQVIANCDLGPKDFTPAFIFSSIRWEHTRVCHDEGWNHQGELHNALCKRKISNVGHCWCQWGNFLRELKLTFFWFDIPRQKEPLRRTSFCVQNTPDTPSLEPRLLAPPFCQLSIIIHFNWLLEPCAENNLSWLPGLGTCSSMMTSLSSGCLAWLFHTRDVSEHMA